MSDNEKGSAKIESDKPVKTESDKSKKETEKVVKTEAKTEVKTEAKNEAKTEVDSKTDVKTEVKSETKQENGTSEPSELEKKIIRQIEYYFGDHNLAKDKFMQTTIKEAADGWVTLELLLTFNRLKTLSPDAEVIVKALRKSLSGLLEIDDESKKIRRNQDKPLPEKKESAKQEEAARTVYVKGFPMDATLDQLLEFFGSVGSTTSIFMRKNYKDKKTFKGSIFVTFEDKETADEYYKKENEKYKDKDLLKEMKVEYVKRKEEQFEAQKKKREQIKIDKKLKRKAEGLDPEEDENKEENDDPKESFNPEDIEKGCLLKLSGLSDKVSWEDLKELFRHHAEVAYVDYSRGLPEAIIRFQEPGSAKLALDRATEVAEDKILTVLGGEVKGTVLDGEDEIAFWRTFWQRKHNRERHNHKRGRMHGRGGGGGRGGRGGRGRGRGDRRGGRGDRRGGGGDRRDRGGKRSAEGSATSDQPPAKQNRIQEAASS